MSDKDQADIDAERLLPCLELPYCLEGNHGKYCWATLRSNVAAALREIEKLKKFDVKFACDYDENFHPVGKLYDVLEWQAKLQSELGILKLRHKKLQSQLAAALKANATEYVRGREDEQRARATVENPYIESLKAQLDAAKAEIAVRDSQITQLLETNDKQVIEIERLKGG